jgi:hypothetical protein
MNLKKNGKVFTSKFVGAGPSSFKKKRIYRAAVTQRLRNTGLVCSFSPNCTLDGHLHRVTYTKNFIDTIHSPDDEHGVARNMYRSEINI